MDGRVALITGAARGIGLAIASALASAGCAVAIQDIDFDLAEAEAKKITDEGGRAIGIGGDLVDLSVPAAAVSQTLERLGGLDVLINNGSIEAQFKWQEMPLEEIHRQVNADMVSPLLFCQQAAPHLRKHHHGRIINIGSIQQLSGNDRMIAYAMSKAALENMTRGLARTMGHDGVTVNMIAPGWFHTWRTRESFQNLEDKVRHARWMPLKRVGEPQDCAGVALLLASDAGAYITGQTIYVDGGMSI